VAQRVRRFREEVELIKALWTEDKITYRGQIFQVENVKLATRPVRKPHPPLWMGVGHPDAVRRAAALADGWMGSGGSSIAEFKASVPILKRALEAAGRDPTTFPISKRVFMAVDERPAVARRELERWFTEVYHNPPGTEASGFHGTPEQVRERLATFSRWAIPSPIAHSTMSIRSSCILAACCFSLAAMKALPKPVDPR
jgi:alkanesulfonate monooxygenase SsuD/methylene tetrahydromethanopterin reductase-like flavin-dependent oxidoreductase (luciferase family)